jgi:hypothetical protein
VALTGSVCLGVPVVESLATASKMELGVGDGSCCGLVDVDLVVELLAQAASTFQHSLTKSSRQPA